MTSKTFERFDLVVIPFHFTDKASTKRRPAVALSGGAGFNRASKHGVLAMVTSATERAWQIMKPQHRRDFQSIIVCRTLSMLVFGFSAPVTK